MRSAYQIDRELMAAWLKWIKAQEKADRAKSEYDKVASEMKKRLEEDETKHEPTPQEKAAAYNGTLYR